MVGRGPTAVGDVGHAPARGARVLEEVERFRRVRIDGRVHRVRSQGAAPATGGRGSVGGGSATRRARRIDPLIIWAKKMFNYYSVQICYLFRRNFPSITQPIETFTEFFKYVKICIK